MVRLCDEKKMVSSLILPPALVRHKECGTDAGNSVWFPKQ